MVDLAFALLVCDLEVTASGRLLEPREQAGGKEDVVCEDDHLAGSREVCDAFGHLLNAAMVEARHGIVEDDGRRDTGEPSFSKKVRKGEDLLLTFRQDLRGLVVGTEDLAALWFAFTANELEFQLWSTQCFAFFGEQLAEVLV